MRRPARFAWLLIVALLVFSCSNANAESDAKTEKRWYLGVKVSNYRPDLEEFERRIDAEINGTLGRAFLAWQQPETFKDWSDNGEIWDFWVEAGRDLSARTAWSIAIGGTGATLQNKRTYFLAGLPLKTDIRFRGTELSAIGSFAFYPFGKPVLDHRSETWNIVKRAVLRARPYGEFGLGYTFVRAEGSVTLGLPILERLYKNKEVSRHHMLLAHPRIGLEFPLNNHDSVALTAGYRFHHEHGSEFDSPTFSAVFKHRF